MISRFNFNISIYENFKNIINIVSYRNDDYELNLKNELTLFYKNSNFHFFDHGRTAFREVLAHIKEKTKKRKILINSLTFFEVVNVIIYSGFEPVFIDTQENSFQTEINLNNYKDDLSQIAGIVITHLNGINENIIQLKKQIEDHNTSDEKIYLIEDCAVGMGAIINKQNAGSFGDFSFLSFNIMKNITCYTGGALINNLKQNLNIDKKKYNELSKIDLLKKAIFVLIIQILNTKLFFPLFFRLVKYSYKYSFNFLLRKYRADFQVEIKSEFPSKFSFFMHSFQKKILLKQFKNMEEKRISRTNKSKIYYEKLNKIKHLYFPQKEFTELNIFLDFPILCTSKEIKEKLFQYLMERKIDVKNYYYKNCSEEKIYSTNNVICKNSKKISENILMLPVHEKITEQYQYEIINEIKNFFESKNYALH